ncbi:FAD binding domain-containing protein [Paenibacillus sp. P96]|uniref:FAD binding domain-containing protein n=1 Tax=Paenibacillus zeirhizosphaerae TaxID=2987519 RepID=A0ABT9FVJ8_9BACL|nr:FAD binding domain-containing protein [Paenibacillus sp. P96]MDP4098725.1 FAD binding domain-containing protein [Paenibacillus sp. P96]
MSNGNPVICPLPAVRIPAVVEEAMHWKNTSEGTSCYVGGGTLLRTQWEGDAVPLPQHIIALNGIANLQGISLDNGMLSVGALTSLAECCRNPLLAVNAPLLAEAARLIGAPSIRTTATIGGNIASGIGDSIPALLVLRAQLEWHTEDGPVRIAIEDWLERIRQGIHGQEAILQRVLIPIQSGEEVFRFRKIGRREAFTPSLVTVAFMGRPDSGGRWSPVTAAAGGGAGIAMRLVRTEALLQNGLTDLSSLVQTVKEEFETFTDAFASAEYRAMTAGNLLAAELYKLASQV